MVSTEQRYGVSVYSTKLAKPVTLDVGAANENAAVELALSYLDLTHAECARISSWRRMV